MLSLRSLWTAMIFSLLAPAVCQAGQNSSCIDPSLFEEAEMQALRQAVNLDSINREIFDSAGSQEEPHFKSQFLIRAIMSMGNREIPYDDFKPILEKARAKIESYSLDPYERFHDLLWINNYFAANLDFPAAVKIALELESIAWANSQKGRLSDTQVSEEIGQSLSFVVDAFIMAGGFDRAQMLLDEIERRQIENTPTPDQIAFQKAVFFFNNQDYRKSIELLRKVASDSDNSVLIRGAYELIVISKQELGDEISESISELIEYTKKTDFGHFNKWTMLLLTGRTLANLELNDRAIELTIFAEELVRGVSDRNERNSLAGDIINIANHYTDIGRDDLASTLIKEAHGLVVEYGQTFNGLSINDVLAIVGATYARANDFESARQILGMMESPIDRSRIQLAITGRAISDGEFAMACETIRSISNENFDFDEADERASWSAMHEFNRALENTVAVIADYAVESAGVSPKSKTDEGVLLVALKLTRMQQDAMTQASSLGHILSALSIGAEMRPSP